MSMFVLSRIRLQNAKFLLIPITIPQLAHVNQTSYDHLQSEELLYKLHHSRDVLILLQMTVRSSAAFETYNYIHDVEFCEYKQQPTN